MPLENLPERGPEGPKLIDELREHCKNLDVPVFLAGSAVRQEKVIQDLDCYFVGDKKPDIPNVISGKQVSTNPLPANNLREFILRSVALWPDVLSCLPVNKAAEVFYSNNIVPIQQEILEHGRAVLLGYLVASEETMALALAAGKIRRDFDDPYEKYKRLPGGKRSMMRYERMINTLVPDLWNLRSDGSLYSLSQGSLFSELPQFSALLSLIQRCREVAFQAQTSGNYSDTFQLMEQLSTEYRTTLFSAVHSFLVESDSEWSETVNTLCGSDLKVLHIESLLSENTDPSKRSVVVNILCRHPSVPNKTLHQIWDEVADWPNGRNLQRIIERNRNFLSS